MFKVKEKYISMEQSFFSALVKTDDFLTGEERENEGRKIFQDWWLDLPSSRVARFFRRLFLTKGPEKTKEEILKFFQEKGLSTEEAENLFTAILERGFYYDEFDQFVVVKTTNQKGDRKYDFRYIILDRSILSV